MAEYEACILCLKMVIDMNVYELLVIGDSDLLVHQVQGEGVVKNPKIIPYMQYVQKLCKRFGVTESIITDNGSNLNSQLMRDICEQFKITHQNSIAYRPQMKRTIKAANNNIKKIRMKMIDNHRGWHEMLPYALLGYRMTVRTSTGATSYLLVYGTEAVRPAEVEIPSLRIIQEAVLSNVEWVSQRIDQLTLIDEKRMVVVCHGQLYRQRMI
ncbi:uncharacterized protein LOC107019384 [Solanum pennellii]|uniref:Uncharacterized protein LOC107019384 n=1 Tax=Solanum pennellii TaxID=28526 RepID=A0ABM1GSR4_SOLPN|nr:uncharacterized protein LOC107019384 [Solanum pennellii]